MKNRTSKEYINTYEANTKHLTDVGLHPEFQVLHIDNECSEALQQTMSDSKAKFQLH